MMTPAQGSVLSGLQYPYALRQQSCVRRNCRKCRLYVNFTRHRTNAHQFDSTAEALQTPILAVCATFRPIPRARNGTTAGMITGWVATSRLRSAWAAVLHWPRSVAIALAHSTQSLYRYGLVQLPLSGGRTHRRCSAGSGAAGYR